MLGSQSETSAMNTPPPDDPLDPLLDRWASTPDPSPRLTAEVWQRIATGETRPRQDRGLWAAFEAWLERPVYAVGFVAACALLGIFLAEIRIGQVQRERNAQLARSYLQLIDPLVNANEPERRS
jgi:hypothetical protein